VSGGESAQIAKKAVKLSEKLFPLFYWERVGPADINWECVKSEQHNARKKHPSDAVYRYIDPYEKKPVYILFDFKSLANKSINSSLVNGALRNLAHSIDCAMVSEEWQKLYLQEDSEIIVKGSLMVYNHDGSYTRKLANQIHPSLYKDWPELQSHQEIVILEPETLVYLNSIVTDARILRDEFLPSKEQCGFFHPDLHLQYHIRASENRTQLPALPEQLNSPFLIMRYEVEEKGKEGFLIYYKGEGKSSDEFIYLIDYLFHYQIIDHASVVNIRMPYAANESPSQFERAINEYSQKVAPSEAVAEEIKKRLKCMQMEPIDRIVPKFLETHLGME